jgi:hypothetical protein
MPAQRSCSSARRLLNSLIDGPDPVAATPPETTYASLVASPPLRPRSTKHLCPGPSTKPPETACSSYVLRQRQGPRLWLTPEAQIVLTGPPGQPVRSVRGRQSHLLRCHQGPGSADGVRLPVPALEGGGVHAGPGSHPLQPGPGLPAESSIEEDAGPLRFLT